MDAVWLASGSRGLGGLLEICLEAIDKVQSYQDFNNDSKILKIQFTAERLRLERWGRKVGLQSENTIPVAHQLLDDSRLSSTVTELLLLIKDIFEQSDTILRSDLSTKDVRASSQSNDEDLGKPPSDPSSQSKRQKLSWVFRGKKALLADRLDLLKVSWNSFTT